MFAGKTYDEAMDIVANETAEVMYAYLDGEVNAKDFMETAEAGMAWNAAMKIPGLDKKLLWAHVLIRLGRIGLDAALPLPEGTIPTS